MRTETTKKLFTVDEYYKMVDVGILQEGDRTELIEGEIIQMSPMGSLHAAVVTGVNDVLVPLFKGKALLRPQLPLRLNEFNEPQPDVVLLKPRQDCYSSRHPGSADVLRATIFVAGGFAVVFSLQKRWLEKRIDALTEEASRLQQEVETAREAEAQRIAADFHDGPLQSFISIQMRLEIFRKILERDREAGFQELQQLQELSKSQVRDMRSYVRNMRPLDVDGASITAATRRLLDEFQKESGIPVTFVGGERPFAAPPEISADIVQVIREALNNVRKHSKATRVAVALEKVGKILEISIDDNGVGFHFSGAYSLDELDLLRMGPVSLKRRARSLGADLLLESRPGHGAGLKMKIPI